jgi:hypothetical protein
VRLNELDHEGIVSRPALGHHIVHPGPGHLTGVPGPKMPPLRIGDYGYSRWTYSSKVLFACLDNGRCPEFTV